MFRARFTLLGVWICGAALAAPNTAISNTTPQEQCKRTCEAQQQAFVERCLGAGGSQRECEMGGQRFLEECLRRCAAADKCRRQCQQRAKRFYRECLQNGGTEEACAQAARELLEKCIDEHCVPPCEERCAVQARQGYNQCIADGGSEADCRARAEHFLRMCTAHCSPDCKERCAALGHEMFRRCIEEGGAKEECAAKGRRVAAECVEANCERECGGIMGLPCPKGQFCQFPTGECHIADNMGVCRVVPEACPLVYEPVCGCDGETYGNACAAAAAGVSIDYTAACYQRCGGIDHEPCPETHYCFVPEGGCPSPEVPGLCRARPPFGLDCPGPVCGCDGKTYLSSCDAAAAGTAVMFYGLCRDEECYQHDPEGCPEGSFCEIAPGECEIEDNIGVCEDIPDDCSGDTTIVCGCDGVTYSECQAKKAGVSIDHAGYCEGSFRFCGGDRNHGPCRPGAYCRFQDGECGHSDGPGICHVIPSACPDVFDPVCGCNGKTYDNACEAAAAEVSIDYAGECPE